MIAPDREFDPFDILANLVGSSVALGLCTLYHKRMLDRKRKRKLEGYGRLAAGEGEEDLELGEGVGMTGQESGTVANADDEDGGEAWDEIGGEDSETGDIGKLTPSTASAE